MQKQHKLILKENQNIKGEAQILMSNLEEIKKSLRRVKDYSQKIGEVIELKVDTVSQKTGIGPLNSREFSLAHAPVGQILDKSNQVPFGINIDKLSFRPILDELNQVHEASQRRALELQNLLGSLSQKKSLLASIPTIMPVKGWVASNYGSRISPFTGEMANHRGIDIAAAPGTPILAPADGVITFSGAKEGFGNFISIAHYGSGIITHYGHNAHNLVHTGQKISRGDQIASVGATGNTTGPHLHYEVLVNGRTVNPRKFILDSDADLF